jgi:hypothetical protein
VLDTRSGGTTESVVVEFDKESWAKTSADFASLGNVKQNLVLRFKGLELADTALSRLDRWPNVRGVVLDRCTLAPETLERIASLPNLRDLWLSRGNASDLSLAHFAAHSKLRIVSLEGQVFTDGAIEHLRKIKDLDRIRVRLHGLSQEGVARLHSTIPQADILVTEPGFEVPIWKRDKSKEFVYVLPKDWKAQDIRLPHDVITLPAKDGARRNIVVQDQPGMSTLAELKAKYERDLPGALVDFQLVKSELLPSADAPQMVRIIHVNKVAGVAVRQVNYILSVGGKRYFVVATVLKDDDDKYDKRFEAFVESLSPPDDAP